MKIAIGLGGSVVGLRDLERVSYTDGSGEGNIRARKGDRGDHFEDESALGFAVAEKRAT